MAHNVILNAEWEFGKIVLAVKKSENTREYKH